MPRNRVYEPPSAPPLVGNDRPPGRLVARHRAPTHGESPCCRIVPDDRAGTAPLYRLRPDQDNKKAARSGLGCRFHWRREPESNR